MGSMRKGLGGFVGGLKNLAQGFLSSWHSLTSVAPVGPTPDCFVGFISAIADPDTSAVGFISAISDTNGFISAIDATDAGFNSSISDINGFNGDICND